MLDRDSRFVKRGESGTMRTFLSPSPCSGRGGRLGALTAICIALPCRYFVGKYAGRGGIGDLRGSELIGVCDRIDDSEGLGVRNDPFDVFGVYMPRPTVFSCLLGSNVVLEWLNEATNVCEDSEVDERHLNDISENFAR